MAFSVPTLAEVVRTVENGFSTAFYGSSGVLRVTVLKLLARVIGAAVYLPLLSCRYFWKNSFVESADAEGLIRIGSDYTLPHKPATFAHGPVTFIGGDSGTVVPAGTVLVDEASGCEFETLQRVVLSGSNSVEIKALAVGSESNVGNCYLKVRDYLAGVGTIAASGIYGGCCVDVQVGSNVEQWGEGLEDYRARLKFRKSNQPQGGCAADYVGWCMRFDCVTDVYPFQNWPNTNSVTLFVANMNNLNCQVPAADVAVVNSYVNSADRKPLCSAPAVVSVTSVKIGLSITLSDLSENNKTSVVNALKSYLRKFGPDDTLQKVDLQAVVCAVTGDSSAVVGQIFVAGYGYTNSYTLPKTNSSGVLVGKIVDVNDIVISWS